MRLPLPLLFALGFGVCALGLQSTGCPADQSGCFSACSSSEKMDSGDSRLTSNSLSTVESTIPTSGDDMLTGCCMVEHDKEEMEEDGRNNTGGSHWKLA